jgi:hypothetical protein
MKDCPVPGCGTRIDNSLLMCSPHWWSVPTSLRNRVFTTFRKGRGVLDERYLEAAEAAVNAATDKAVPVREYA